MNAYGKASLLAIALTAGASSQAVAQQECEVPEGRPREVAQALVALTQASSTDRPDQKERHLKNAMKLLTENPEQVDRANEVGRNYVLGKVLITWMQQPGIGFDATRGQIGMTSNPEARIDLVAAADSAFENVVRLMPHCAKDLEDWRQQQPWVELINAAIGQLNAGNLDSAEVLVNRSMVLTDQNPFGPNLLSTIAQSRNDLPRAIELRRQTLELAKGDTLYNEIRVESMYNLAALLGARAEEMPDGPEKAAMAREAASLFQQFAAEVPDSPNAVSARAGHANMLMLAGDTSAVAGMYADQIANPSNYSDLQLVHAGVVAARAENAPDAAKLFGAALEVNPNNRDALYNLAASEWALKNFDAMFPILQRLIALDPNNPDNLRLLAYAFQGKQEGTEGAARRALTDSIVKYVEQSEKLPASIIVQEFSRGSTEATFTAALQNKGTAPKTFQVTVEFLDKSGAVVGTQQATVGPVPPNQSQSFTVELEQPNIHSWRYRVQG